MRRHLFEIVQTDDLFTYFVDYNDNDDDDDDDDESTSFKAIISNGTNLEQQRPKIILNSISQLNFDSLYNYRIE